VLAPAAEYAPAGQLVHTDEDVEPEAEEYMPAGQFKQLDERRAMVYVPAEQLVQADAPLREYNPTEQEKHETAPVPACNFLPKTLTWTPSN